MVLRAGGELVPLSVGTTDAQAAKTLQLGQQNSYGGTMHLNGISNSTALAQTERYMYVGANRDGTPGRKRETFSLRSNNSSSSSSL